MLFDGRAAIVTGGGSGIGQATVVALAAEGASVLVSDIDEEGGEAVATEVRDAGGKAAFMRVDVAEAGQVEALIDRALSEFGRLDLAYNNAGIEGPQALLAEQDMAAVQHVFAVMIEGVYLCMQAEIPAMLESGGGSIVNAGSMWGLAAYPLWSPYMTAKHAVLRHDQGGGTRLCQGRHPGERGGTGADSDPPSSCAAGTTTPPMPRAACRWGGSAGPRRSPTRWSGCSRTRRASSLATCCRWTAACWRKRVDCTRVAHHRSEAVSDGLVTGRDRGPAAPSRRRRPKAGCRER